MRFSYREFWGLNVKDHLDDQIRRAALERFGLAADTRDYTIERVVRLAAIATACRFASFSLRSEGHSLHVGAYGVVPGEVPDYQLLVEALPQPNELLFVDNVHEAVADVAGMSESLTDIRAGRAAIAPVYGATMSVIGHLTVVSATDRTLDTKLNHRVLTDCVRLIEDALMMRGDAIRDPLTGLYNRRFFNQQIASEWRRALRLQLPISMLVVDIDYFKRYNDSLGHIKGDAAIQLVARILKSRVRRAGDVICRFGGEEFAMILPSTSAEDAQSLGDSIRLAVEAGGLKNPGHPDGPMQPLTVSIGTATVGHRSELLQLTALELLGAADDALYQAKQAGRNCVASADLAELIDGGDASRPIPEDAASRIKEQLAD